MACVISFKVPPPTVSYLLNQPRQLCPEPAPLDSSQTGRWRSRRGRWSSREGPGLS